MKQSNPELSVGVFVILGLAAIIWFAVQAGAGVAIGNPTYEVKARFSNIGGLKTGNQVLIAGVPVGRVGKIFVDDQFAAIVNLDVQRQIHLPVDTIASIKTSGLIGDRYVALAPGADTDTIQPGGAITDTEAALDLESLISRYAFGSVSASPSPSPTPSSLK